MTYYDYESHPLWTFSQNHPEKPDVCHDDALRIEMFDEAFDGEWLVFAERMMLAMDDCCYQRTFSPEYDITAQEVAIIARGWAITVDDYLMVLNDMMMFLDMNEGR